MRERIEPRLRQLVADVLAVDTADLGVDVSLVDDLAADSLDVLEVAIVTEAAFGIVIPSRALAGVRTFGDLLALACDLLRPPAAPALPIHVRAHTVAVGGGATIERSGAVTPYLVEIIADDARHAGPGARVDLIVPADTGTASLGALAAMFSALEGRGVDVRVGRDAARQSSGASRVMGSSATH